jgi:hypothetical protein
MMPENKGIIVQGHGRIDATQLVAGGSASIIYGSGNSITDAQSKLDNLLSAIDKNRKALSNPDEIRENAQLVAKEVVKQSPNRLTITALLDGVCSAVKSATGVALAAEAFKAAIEHLLV